MKKIVAAVLLWVLASCSADKTKSSISSQDAYSGLWNMLVTSVHPENKPLKNDATVIFKDASHSTGKGKVAVGTA